MHRSLFTLLLLGGCWPFIPGGPALEKAEHPGDDDDDDNGGIDEDGDSFASVASGGEDCDDTDPEVHPDAQEVCDTIDNDCNGQIDDDDPQVDLTTGTTFFLDEDEDGFGNSDASIRACRAPAGGVAAGDDCDDADPQRNPGNSEVPCDEIDNDCDPSTGDVEDLDGDEVTSCTDCDDTDPMVNPYMNETCNGIDDDCNPATDEDLLDGLDWYDDNDGDGYGAGSVVATQCADPGTGAVPGPLMDCADNNPARNPGEPEDCSNGVDDNCDLLTDCADPTCAGVGSCVGCADVVLGGGFPVLQNGSTTGQGDDLTPSCTSFSTATDVVLQWTPPSAGTYTFSLAGSSYDTVLYLIDGCGGSEIACNDDAVGLQSELQAFLPGGVPVLIVVDGYSSYNGPFTLEIF